MRQTGESSWEYLQAISSWFTIRGWTFRARNAWVWLRIDLPRRVWLGPDARRVARFSSHQDAAGPNPPEATARANWPVDIDVEIDCWRGQRRVRMLGCRWDGDYLVCETRVSTGPVEPVRGLICIRRDALEILPNDRQRRIAGPRAQVGTVHLPATTTLAFCLRAASAVAVKADGELALLIGLGLPPSWPLQCDSPAAQLLPTMPVMHREES